jgi:2-phospho-L-lactate/phosphoenolpyruvate guanylyltransferase
MKICTIIPVKPFAEAKRRLAPALSPDKRARLAQDLFQHVLATALKFSRSVIVVSRAHEILEIAESQGAIGLKEKCRPYLNAALEQAAMHARAQGATKLLIVPSDLPLLAVADLRVLAKEECAIAPDRHRCGTNALLWPASQKLKFQFGPNSFQRHLAAATEAGLHPRILLRPGFAHDVDVPEDMVGMTDAP